MIKNKALVVSEHTEGKKTEITIKKNNPGKERRFTKLGDVYDAMPSGVMYKEETGLGATTLELKAKRNSIIVEPIRVTASTKAEKHEAQFVGTLPNKTKSTPKREILDYLNSSTSPKKFVVVADSLQNLIRIIGETAFTDFFLMIDEIDSFQLDSSYRHSMDICIDIYKQFPVDKRAMVTATPLDFSDPDLINEHITHIKYDEPISRNMQLFTILKKFRNAVMERIVSVLDRYPNDKIMIAYNSVTGCYDIAEHLHNELKIPKEDIKILCSSSNKNENLKDYSTELSKEILPGKINLLTSAYFTGYDLSERYHLISVSSCVSKIHSLSDKRLKQIAGRCRHKNGLISETVVHDVLPSGTELEMYSSEQLIQAAKTEIAAIKCIENNYHKHEILKSNITNIRNLIIENTTTNSGHRFVRNKDGNHLVSYLNIDSFIESVRVRNELYKLPNALYKVLLKAGNSIEYFDDMHGGETDVKRNSVENKNRAAEIKQLLEDLKHKGIPFSKDDIHALSAFQWGIYKNYVLVEQYFVRNPFLKLIEKAAQGRDSRKLNSLFTAAYYVSLHPDSFYKRIVAHHIRLGQTYIPEELLEKWNTIFAECGLQKSIDNLAKAVRFTKLHYHTTKRRDPVIGHHMLKENPLKLPIAKRKPHKPKPKAPKVLTPEEIAIIFPY